MKATSHQTVNRQSLHLQIDRVSVQGLDARGQQRFVRALESRLNELAAKPAFRTAMQAGPLHLPSLRAGKLPSGTTPEDAAGQVVRTLHQQLIWERGVRNDA
jgi:hypothetical protein